MFGDSVAELFIPSGFHLIFEAFSRFHKQASIVLCLNGLDWLFIHNAIHARFSWLALFNPQLVIYL